MPTDLPYPPDTGGTHWRDCWRTPHHHNCAVLEIDRLRERVVELERRRDAERAAIVASQELDLDLLRMLASGEGGSSSVMPGPGGSLKRSTRMRPSR